MKTYLPILDWLPAYRKADLRGDLTAGFTVAVMLIPQAMALAMLAGLPPVLGLYASVAPLLIYAVFGTSRQLSVGPVALISLLVASGIGDLAEQGTAEYIAYATLLAGMVGLIQFSMGLARVGFLVNFLSHPVVSGFISASAVIIALSQLKHIFGVSIPRSQYVHQVVADLIEQLPTTNVPTLIIGVSSVILLGAIKRWKSTFPRGLVVVAAASAVVWLLKLESAGVMLVGELPRGLHGLTFPDVNGTALSALMPIAVAIALIAFMESVAVAKRFARENHYEVHANQELIGLGLANLGASVFGAYPVTGGFSRSAVNAQAGARTGLASILTALIVAITLLFLTNMFRLLPTASLAAIIIVAVAGLIDIKEIRHLYKVKRIDFIAVLVTFVTTIALGVERGLLVSIAVSLILVMKRTTRPHYAILGRLPGTSVYRNVDRFGDARTLDGVIMIRIDASLYFANAHFLKDLIGRQVAKYPHRLRAIILDASSINDIDASADVALHEIADTLESRDVTLCFTNVKGPVRDVLQRSGLYDRIGSDRFFYTNQDAVLQLLKDSRDDVSPHSNPA